MAAVGSYKIKLKLKNLEQELKQLRASGAPEEEIDNLVRKIFILEDEIYCLNHYDEVNYYGAQEDCYD